MPNSNVAPILNFSIFYAETASLALTTALTANQLRSVINLRPSAAQVITMPSIADMMARGFQPGMRVTLVRDETTAFPVSIVPFAGDAFAGQTVPSIMLQPGLTGSVELQLSAFATLGVFSWSVTARMNDGLSEGSIVATGAVAAGLLQRTNVITGVGAGTIVLPAITSLLAIGWPTGTDFTFVRDNTAGVLTVTPNGADTFFGGAVISFPAATAGSSGIVRIPAAGPGAWRVLKTV